MHDRTIPVTFYSLRWFRPMLFDAIFIADIFNATAVFKDLAAFYGAHFGAFTAWTGAFRGPSGQPGQSAILSAGVPNARWPR